MIPEVALAAAVLSANVVMPAVLFGRIADTDGAGFSGASVTLKSHDSSETLVAHTLNDGSYRFEPIPPGSYSFSASITGFLSVRFRSLVLASGRAHRFDAKLLPDVPSAPSVVESVAPETDSYALPPVQSEWIGAKALIEWIHFTNLDDLGLAPARIEAIRRDRELVVQQKQEGDGTYLRVFWARGLSLGLVVGRPASRFPVCGEPWSPPEGGAGDPRDLPRLGPTQPAYVDVTLRLSLPGVDAIAMQWLAAPWTTKPALPHGRKEPAYAWTKAAAVSTGRWWTARFPLSTPEGAPKALVGLCLAPLVPRRPGETLLDVPQRYRDHYIDVSQIRVVGR